MKEILDIIEETIEKWNKMSSRDKVARESPRIKYLGLLNTFQYNDNTFVPEQYRQ